MGAKLKNDFNFSIFLNRYEIFIIGEAINLENRDLFSQIFKAENLLRSFKEKL